MQRDEDLDFSVAPPEAAAAIMPPPEEVLEPEVIAPLPAVVDYDTQKAVTRLYLFEKKVNDRSPKAGRSWPSGMRPGTPYQRTRLPS